ncbi:MAG: DUF5658 family protein [Myxococcota bacterium]
MAEPFPPLSDERGDGGSEPTWPVVDRRRSADRRSRPTRFFDSVLGHRRRRAGRRAGEGADQYVDRLGTRGIALALAVFALNIFDAFCTLVWLRRGGSEGNPIMDWALDAGDSVFLFQKCFVAAIWIVVLVVHKNFRLARLGLWSLLVVYALLAIYHGFLALCAEPVPHP